MGWNLMSAAVDCYDWKLNARFPFSIQDGPLRFLEEIWLGLHRPAVVNPALYL